MKKIMIKLDDKQGKQIIARQIAKEVKLLKQSDPDRELKEEIEKASLLDLKKYLEGKESF
jgi:hypothetical protein